MLAFSVNKKQVFIVCRFRWLALPVTDMCLLRQSFWHWVGCHLSFIWSHCVVTICSCTSTWWTDTHKQRNNTGLDLATIDIIWPQHSQFLY